MKYEIKRKSNQLSFNELKNGEYFRLSSSEFIRMKLSDSKCFVFNKYKSNEGFVKPFNEVLYVIKLKPIAIENDIMIFEEV